jgi:hypothetical protein
LELEELETAKAAQLDELERKLEYGPERTSW